MRNPVFVLPKRPGSGALLGVAWLAFAAVERRQAGAMRLRLRRLRGQDRRRVLRDRRRREPGEDQSAQGARDPIVRSRKSRYMRHCCSCLSLPRTPCRCPG